MQALAIGKPLDKMQSVPEAAVEGEGLPTADQLNRLGYSVGENQAQPDQGDKVICWAGSCTALTDALCDAGGCCKGCTLCLTAPSNCGFLLAQREARSRHGSKDMNATNVFQYGRFSTLFLGVAAVPTVITKAS